MACWQIGEISFSLYDTPEERKTKNDKQKKQLCKYGIIIMAIQIKTYV